MAKQENKKVKICVAVREKTDEAIKAAMQKAKVSKADVVEWRVDFYENAKMLENVIGLLKEIRAILDNKELMFTYRSEHEGGENTLSTPEYLLLYKTVILTKLADYVDVEFLLGDTIINNIVKHARLGSTKVLMSNHDWDSTPRSDIIENRIKVMLEKGADIAKVACMPRNEEDVEEMMKAGKNLSNEHENIILISMGELGKKTKLEANTIGTCMTFASLDKNEIGHVFIDDLYEQLNK